MMGLLRNGKSGDEYFQRAHKRTAQKARQRQGHQPVTQRRDFSSLELKDKPDVFESRPLDQQLGLAERERHPWSKSWKMRHHFHRTNKSSAVSFIILTLVIRCVIRILVAIMLIPSALRLMSGFILDTCRSASVSSVQQTLLEMWLPYQDEEGYWR
ncbi:hypothetical protein ACHAP5_010417 [Fusarium lateritium]